VGNFSERSQRRSPGWPACQRRRCSAISPRTVSRSSPHQLDDGEHLPLLDADAVLDHRLTQALAVDEDHPESDGACVLSGVSRETARRDEDSAVGPLPIDDAKTSRMSLVI
jgi:hypothetical protein